MGALSPTTIWKVSSGVPGDDGFVNDNFIRLQIRQDAKGPFRMSMRTDMGDNLCIIKVNLTTNNLAAGDTVTFQPGRLDIRLELSMAEEEA